MKDFVKWLGVNEKVAKIVVWMLIFMGFLIMFNTLLDSLGLPFYKVTVENLSRIKISEVISYLCTILVSYFNFWSIMILILPISKIKKIFPYSIIYIIMVAMIGKFLPYIISQIFIPIYIALLSYILSDKNKKYIIYGIVSLIINSTVQYICYYIFKGKYLDSTIIEGLNYIITSLDYFIVMILIILSKEVYLKYRKKEV